MSQPESSLGKPSRASSAFVGRVRELERLGVAYSSALRGELAIVLVTGEPGIGKTALVEFFARQIVGEEANLWWGRCWDGTDAPPLWPWARVLRSGLEELEDSRFAELRTELSDVLASVEGRKQSDEGGQVLEARGGELQLFERVVELLVAASKVRPLVVVVDDLHDADPSSLALFRYLARDTRPQRTVLVATYRDTEVMNDALLAATSAAARARRSTYVRLEGLDAADSVALAGAWLGDSHTEEDLASIGEAAAGNPFFITQVARLIDEQGSTLDPDDIPIHGSVSDVVAQRISALPTGCTTVLETAAIVGREFERELVVEACELSPITVGESLDTAERVRLVRKHPGSDLRWSFTHDVVRSAISANLSSSRRAALHDRVAEALLALEKRGRTVDPLQLALHLGASGTADGCRRGAQQAMLAAERERRTHAHENAARSIALARALLENAGEALERRFELLLAEARERCAAGNIAESRHAAMQALTLARDLDRADAMALVGLTLSIPGSRFITDREVIDVLEEAIERADDHDPTLPMLRSRLAMELGFSSPSRSQALLADVIASARADGNDEVLIDALIARRWAIWNPDHAEELIDLGSEIVEIGTRLQRPDLILHGHHARRAGFHELGNVERMDDEVAASDLIGRAHRLPLQRAWSAAHGAMKATAAGRFAEASYLLEDVQAVADQVGDDQFSTQFIPLQVQLAREQERDTDARMLFELTRDFRPDMLVIEAGLLGVRRSLEEDVVGELPALVDRLTDGPADWFWLAAAAETAVNACCVGDADSAGRLLEVLMPYALLHRNVAAGPTLSLGAAGYYAGLCAASVGDVEHALRLLGESIDDNERMRAHLWSLRARTAEIEIRREIGQSDEHPSMAEALTHGRQLSGLVEAGVARRAFLGVVAVARDDAREHSLEAAGGLTEREMEILRLVSEGMSNQALAETLHLSVKTIERHLTNIYGKLRVRNRAEASAWAAKHGHI